MLMHSNTGYSIYQDLKKNKIVINLPSTNLTSINNNLKNNMLSSDQLGAILRMVEYMFEVNDG